MVKSNFFVDGGAGLTSNREDWETPQHLFDKLHEIYNFTIDVASNDQNAKLNNYYTKEDDALTKNWGGGGSVFCNPPYGRNLRAWCQKAYEESRQPYNEQVVMVIPARTDTKYWHDFIFGKAQVTFLQGRLKFEIGGKPSKSGAPFSTAVVVFNKNFKNDQITFSGTEDLK